LSWINAAPELGRDTEAMTLTLTRKLILLTAVKLAALAAIYGLLFAPVSRSRIDAVGHIAGSGPHLAGDQ
jgi:hypothetical protein